MFDVFGFYKFKKLTSLKKNKILLQDYLIKKNIRGTIIIANSLINAAGLEAHNITGLIDGFSKDLIPKIYYAKGNYFETNKKLGIKHLIYPLPTEASLGLHLGLDLSMQMRFGPDVEWVDQINYTVDPSRAVSYTHLTLPTKRIV